MGINPFSSGAPFEEIKERFRTKDTINVESFNEKKDEINTVYQKEHWKEIETRDFMMDKQSNYSVRIPIRTQTENPSNIKPI